MVHGRSYQKDFVIHLVKVRKPQSKAEEENKQIERFKQKAKKGREENHKTTQEENMSIAQ